jgi:Cdc6-like AAA superfamily ATPase
MSRRASSKGDRTLLGVGWTNGVPVYISDAELANHVMVVGTTGRGKTVTTLNLVEAHMSRHSG